MTANRLAIKRGGFDSPLPLSQNFQDIQHVFELISEDDRTNVHAAEVEVRPPPAPTRRYRPVGTLTAPPLAPYSPGVSGHGPRVRDSHRRL